ncbi:MAG: hypothetical protein KatS3mg060_3085 [Dehalococcoidia bacterium]|nr:MAG: hypothetical protein KatS3mg060_3085 [Dehalococcoidia bacterium]
MRPNTFARLPDFVGAVGRLQFARLGLGQVPALHLLGGLRKTQQRP